MKYLDETFWKMTLGFMAIVVVGLICIYLLSTYQGTIQASTLTYGFFFGKVFGIA